MNDTEKLRIWFDEWGIDPYPLLIKMFQGIQYEKNNNPDRYYSSKPDDIIQLIKFYYFLVYDSVCFNNLKNTFVTRYVNNESILEQVCKDYEIEGLKAMYEYIFSGSINDDLNIYTLKELHKKLFSKAPDPDFGGSTRTDIVYWPGTKVEFCDWRLINLELYKLDKNELKNLLEKADEIKKSRYNIDDKDEIRCYIDALITYLGECVVLGCKIVKIHPFQDGNKRSVRGFINLLFDKVGLPPVYIKAKERDAYSNAMCRALRDGNYDDIKNFYMFKICDSIIELDIVDRAKRKPEGEKVKKLGTNI